MLSKKEICRRVRAIAALGKKPNKLYSLRRLAKLADCDAHSLSMMNENMWNSTQAKLSQALIWLENDQVRIENGDVKIVAGKPACKMQTRFQLTDKGFRIVKVASNPMAFPDALTQPVKPL